MKHPLNYVFQKGGGRGVGQNYVVLGVLTFYNFVLLPKTFPSHNKWEAIWLSSSIITLI